MQHWHFICKGISNKHQHMSYQLIGGWTQQEEHKTFQTALSVTPTARSFVSAPSLHHTLMPTKNCWELKTETFLYCFTHVWHFNCYQTSRWNTPFTINTSILISNWIYAIFPSHCFQIPWMISSQLTSLSFAFHTLCMITSAIWHGWKEKKLTFRSVLPCNSRKL